MPTYEYICAKCGHQFEQFQSIAARALEVCPKEHCSQTRWGKGKVKRAISGGAGLIFKGSGFYITDYRSENYKQAAQKDSSSATKTEAKSSTAETKPAPTKADASPAKASPKH